MKQLFHAAAFLVVAIWGSTFVFTKMLLLSGLSPAQIFTLRFIIAYVLLLAYELIAKHATFRLFCTSVKDEFMMVLLGLTGGSMYFLTENAAMLYTTATNTSLIVCTCPLFAMLLIGLAFRQSEHFTKMQVAGSLMACGGMAAVVMNGHFVLHLSPIGDLLAFSACLCWAVYSLIMKPASMYYGTLLITRKVFFYGLLTIIPFLGVQGRSFSLDVLGQTPVWGNLLFLGLVASLACFIAWNLVIDKLGNVTSTNYVYLNPVFTLLTATIFLGERMTLLSAIGCAAILAGVIWAGTSKKES